MVRVYIVLPAFFCAMMIYFLLCLLFLVPSVVATFMIVKRRGVVEGGDDLVGVFRCIGIVRYSFKQGERRFLHGRWCRCQRIEGIGKITRLVMLGTPGWGSMYR